MAEILLVRGPLAVERELVPHFIRHSSGFTKKEARIIVNNAKEYYFHIVCRSRITALLGYILCDTFFDTPSMRYIPVGRISICGEGNAVSDVLNHIREKNWGNPDKFTHSIIRRRNG